MMLRAFLIVLLIVTACSRVDSGRAARADGAPQQQHRTAPRPSCSIAPPTATDDAQQSSAILPEMLLPDGGINESKLDELMNRMYGDAVKRSNANAAVIQFIEAYVSKNHSNFSKERRFVAFRKGDGWVVDLINVRSLIEGGRDGDLEFHIVEKSGKFKVDSIYAR